MTDNDMQHIVSREDYMITGKEVSGEEAFTPVNVVVAAVLSDNHGPIPELVLTGVLHDVEELVDPGEVPLDAKTTTVNIVIHDPRTVSALMQGLVSSFLSKQYVTQLAPIIQAMIDDDAANGRKPEMYQHLSDNWEAIADVAAQMVEEKKAD